MKVKFLAPRKIDGVMYAPGTHELPDSMSKHWFFLAQVANGSVLMLTEPVFVAQKKEVIVAEEEAILEEASFDEPKKKKRVKKAPEGSKPEEPSKEE